MGGFQSGPNPIPAGRAGHNRANDLGLVHVKALSGLFGGPDAGAGGGVEHRLLTQHGLECVAAAAYVGLR